MTHSTGNLIHQRDYDQQQRLILSISVSIGEWIASRSIQLKQRMLIFLKRWRREDGFGWTPFSLIHASPPANCNEMEMENGVRLDMWRQTRQAGGKICRI